ncbi:MAG: DUF1735 and LamG domain-containing protein [Bacteroides sp.]
MKTISKNIMMAALSFILLSACSTNDGYDNKGFNTSGFLENLLIKPGAENESKILKAAIAKPEGRDIVFTFRVDKSLVNTFNNIYQEKAIILPDENFVLQEPEVVINAGLINSTETNIQFKNILKLDREKVYVLPITVESDDIDLLESAKTTYFIFKGAALINVVADIEKNYLSPTWNNSAVANNLSQLTMEALIYVRDFDNGEISTVMGIEGDFLIRIGDANFERNQVQLATSGGNFPSRDSSKGLPTKEWVHVALTFDEGHVQIYVNGKLQSDGSVNKRTVNLGNNSFYVGKSYNDERWLNGYISECRIWNKVRTQEEINSSIYFVDPTSEGLVSYWKFDDSAGNKVKDHTENGNDLTSNANLKWYSVSLPEDK